MKYIFFLLVFSFSFCCSAQVFHTVLNGRLFMETGEDFPFKLDIIDSAGSIYGSSYTFSKPNDTKATILGKLDRQQGIFTFHELSVEYALSLPTKAFMCLVNVRLSLAGGKLSGNVTSKDASNTSCTPGRLVFNNIDEVSSLFSTHDKYDMAVSMGGRKAAPSAVSPDTAPVETSQDTVGVTKITAGKDRSYEWQSDSVVLELWDGGRVDGDMVSIKLDGATVVNKYTLFKKKRRVVMMIPDFKEHTIAIVAEAEGDDPPSTASLSLRDGSREYALLAYNVKGAISLIKVRRVK